MEQRAYNFSAGPSMMPEEVLKEAQKDLLCYPGGNSSVMEMSHRSKSFEGIINNAENTLREIMNIPENYAILFLQGGATQQFYEVCCNLANTGDTTNYVITGNFAKKALEEAKRRTNAIEIASSKDRNFTYIPEIRDDMISPNAKYLHITGNNTIYGTAYKKAPKHGNALLVADWSSAILGQSINVSDYDVIYAGAQKNMGIAGLAVTIIKKNLIGIISDPTVPVMMQYKPFFENGSMYNTPPCWSIYMAGLMFKWIKNMGGVNVMEERNIKKSSLLYDAIDNSKIFNCPVEKKDRSIMNVVFTLPNEEDTKAFLELTKTRNMINLKGHRSVGGIRASIYNGMPIQGIYELIDAMHDFEKGVRV